MQKQRIHSIDIFRGLTIFLMVLVNELAGVSGIPAWMKHVPPDVDGMTFVDVVFPAFLFIVGMAIPFAVSNREQTGESPLQFWLHIFTRTFGLVILGVYMVNSGEMNTEETLIPKSWWSAALYIAAILIWNRYPKTREGQTRSLYKGLMIFGVLILVLLFFLFRKGEADQLTGMTPSWWGILGLIGWAYALAVILYKISHQQFWTSLGLFIMLLGVLLLLRSDLSGPSPVWQWLQSQSGHITHTIIVWSGIMCSLILARDGLKASPFSKVKKMLMLGVLLLAGGYFSQPFGGISKIAATPAWALYSAAICCLCFPAIYWLVDIKEEKRWADFLKPAGKNPLLTYILPPLFYAVFGYAFIPEWFTHGAWGFMRALVFSLFILWLADCLTKRGIRLHL